MEETGASLEQALARTEADVDAALKAANGLVATLKKLHKATRQGNLRELQSTMNNTEQAIDQLAQKFKQAKLGWDFDEEAYLATPRFYHELRQTAEQNDLKIFMQDDRIFCYPVLIRVLPGDRAVMIDKKRERNLRPTVLIRRLKDLQDKVPRFRPEAFLESLHDAYRSVCALRGKKASEYGAGPIIKLRDIYTQLTLLPGQSKEYSLQEFARDIYLLDQSGVSTTKRGQMITFDASTGTKNTSQMLVIVSRHGEEKKYYGIAFA